ncbi:sarcosine oxidase subunit gamma [Marinomonas posidonica]|uniref:sarcosine oxidase subunit gamma n=1 Tax=Marinomonas posidonica TaxID=936476 RepID=UPI003734D1CB
MSDVNNEALEQAPIKLVMNQLPAADVPFESPLHHVELAKIAEHGEFQGGVVFRELSLGLLTLRCRPDVEQAANIESILGLALPTVPLTSVSSADGELTILWISPDEWLLQVPQDKAFELEARFFAEVSGHVSLVNVSGGNTVFELSGDEVVNVLKKSTPIDFHDSEFPVGKVVSSVFAKSGATIFRTAEQSYQLIVRRSFADYLWLWLQDASKEYGLTVKC